MGSAGAIPSNPWTALLLFSTSSVEKPLSYSGNTQLLVQRDKCLFRVMTNPVLRSLSGLSRKNGWWQVRKSFAALLSVSQSRLCGCGRYWLSLAFCTENAVLALRAPPSMRHGGGRRATLDFRKPCIFKSPYLDAFSPMRQTEEGPGTPPAGLCSTLCCNPARRQKMYSKDIGFVSVRDIAVFHPYRLSRG